MGFKDLISSQRKNYFINAKFQLKYSFLLAALGVVISLIVGFIIIILLNSFTDFLEIAGLDSLPTLTNMLNERMKEFIISIVFLLTTQIICILLIGIYSTHKICGPIYVLERSLKKIIKGIYTEKMSLRKSDDFQTIPKLYNRMVDKLQTKIQEDIAFLKLIETEIDILEKNDAIIKEAADSLSKIKTQANILRQQKDYSLK